MKKYSMSIAALLLAVIMIVASFAACTKKDEPKPTEEPAKTEEVTPEPTEETTPEPTEEPTPEPTDVPANDSAALVGTWTASMNLAEMMNKGLQQDETGMFSDVHLSDVFVDLVMTFNEDGSYTVDADQEALKAALRQISEELLPVMKEFMMGMLSAFSENGEEVTEEQALEMLEIESWDELTEQMMAEFDEDQNQFSGSGMYKLEGDRLILSEGEGAPIDENAEALIITMGSGEFTIVSVENATDEGITEEMLPLVFKKA